MLSYAGVSVFVFLSCSKTNSTRARVSFGGGHHSFRVEHLRQHTCTAEVKKHTILALYRGHLARHFISLQLYEQT
jgi:hypothetical protein